MTTPAAPDRRAWLMWGLPTFLFLIAFFHRVAPGVLAKDLMQAFGATGAVVGLLSATYFYAYAALMIPAGLGVDAFGVRRVVAVGGAVMGLGALVMAASTGQGLLFTGRALVGAGAAVTFVGALKIAADWFPPAYFATLSAVTATMGIVGSLIGTAPLAALVERVGWRGGLVVVGLVTLAGAGLCGWLVRDRPAHPAAGRPRPPLGAVVRGLGQVLGNRHTWPPFLAFFFFISGPQNLLLWVVPYLRDVYGLTTTEAALYATGTSLALLGAAPLTGYLSDRVLRRRKLPYMALTAGSLVCWVVFVATLGRLPLGALYALLFGFGVVGGAFVLTWPIGREVNPPHLAGLAVAATNLGGFLGIALTQGPLGAVLDAHWQGVSVAGARVYPVEAYRVAFAACAGLVFLSFLTTLFLRETRGDNVFAELRRPRTP
jgi:MFS family permease